RGAEHRRRGAARRRRGCCEAAHDGRGAAHASDPARTGDGSRECDGPPASPRRRLLAGERDGLAGGREAYPAEARGGEPTACLSRDTVFDPVVRHGSHCERRDERESRERQQAAPEERPDGRVAPQERMRSQDCHALHRNLRSVLPRRSWFIHSTENGASSLAARATLARSTQGENDLKFAQRTASRDDVRARTHTRLQREIESWNCQDLPLIPRLAGGGLVGRPSWPRRCFSQRSRPAGQADRVQKYLSEHGLRVVAVEESRLYVRAERTIADVQNAFHVAIHNYTSGGRSFRSNVADPVVDEPAGSVVAAVSGLSEHHT